MIRLLLSEWVGIAYEICYEQLKIPIKIDIGKHNI